MVDSAFFARRDSFTPRAAAIRSSRAVLRLLHATVAKFTGLAFYACIVFSADLIAVLAWRTTEGAKWLCGNRIVRAWETFLAANIAGNAKNCAVCPGRAIVFAAVHAVHAARAKSRGMVVHVIGAFAPPAGDGSPFIGHTAWIAGIYGLARS